MGLAVGGAALGERTLAVPWLRVADVTLALAVAWLLPFLLRGRRAHWPAFAGPLAALVGVALLSAAVAWHADGATFVPHEFARSFAKLVFYSVGALVLGAALQQAPAGSLVRLVRLAFGLSGLVGVGLYAAVLAGVDLPDELVCGHGRATCSALYYERRWFGDASPAGLQQDVFLRAQGLSVEPTRFGYLQALALGLLLLRRPARPPGLAEALIAAGALLSFALAPYALLALVALLYAWRLRGRGGRGLRLRTGLGLLILAAALATPPLGPTLHRTVFVRLQRIAAGQLDSSAALRTRGGFAMARELVAHHPATGVGLGHFDLGVESLRARLPERHLLDGNIQGWNVLTYVLGTTGVLGSAAFGFLLWRALRPQPLAGVVFLLGLFADGTLLGAAFWVLLALYSHPAEAADPASGTPAHAGVEPAGPA